MSAVPPRTRARALLPGVLAAPTRRLPPRRVVLAFVPLAVLGAVAGAVAAPSWASQTTAVPAQAAPTTGLPSVGALFSVNAEGTLRDHFCTASVVDSPGKDLLVTAAHCLAGMNPSQVVFIPQYHDGIDPYGLWYATAFYVDRAWQSSADPDDDFAFLTVEQLSSPQPLQDLTGGDQLGIGLSPGEPGPMLHVVGYPDGLDSPVYCASRLKLFSATQLEFDCGGYTTGTSGSPFVVDAAPGTGTGTVIGVIGGYQQGGDTPSVSYAARFEANTRRLYSTAAG